MQIITPVDFTTGMLISSNATESYPAWVSGTNYSTGNTVWYTDGIYQALANHSNNVPPSGDLTHWLKIAPSNHYACFDRQSGNATKATSNLTFTISSGKFNSIALIGIVGAETINIKVRDSLGGTVMWEKDLNLTTSNISDWFEYFFNDPITKLTQFIFSSIPSTSTSHITLTVTGSALSLGEFVFGDKMVLGTTQYGAKVGIIDYSKKTTDDFGNTTLVVRPYSKRLTCSVMVNTVDLNKVQSTLYKIRAKPVVWIATEDDMYSESLIVYGFYKDFNCDLSYPTFGLYSLEVEGLA